jgi:hypothetical protein
MLGPELSGRLLYQQDLTIGLAMDVVVHGVSSSKHSVAMQERAKKTLNCTHCALRRTLVRGRSQHNDNISQADWDASGNTYFRSMLRHLGNLPQ